MSVKPVTITITGAGGQIGYALLFRIAAGEMLGPDTPVRLHGIPQEFLAHAKRAVILERIGLTAQTLARRIVEDVTALDQGGSLLPVE